MRRLRYAVLTDGDTLPRWQHDALATLAAYEGARAELVIENTGAPERRRQPKGWLENRLIGQPGSEEEQLPLPAAFAALPRHRCAKQGHALPPDSVNMIAQQDFDFLVRCGFGVIKGEILQAAHHGVWSFHLGRLGEFTGPAPFFAEMLTSERTVSVVLQRLTDNVGGGTRLYEGSVRTISDSLPATRALALRVCRDFLVKACRDVQAGFSPPNAPAESVRHRPWPTRGQLLQYLLRNTAARLEAKADYLFRHVQWGVGVIEQPVESLLEASTCPKAEWIHNPDRERFIADPAGVVEEDGYGVFVEDLEQREYKGKVTYYKYRPGHGFDGPTDVLEERVHLSYPYLLQHDGRMYCVPEMAAAGEVALYEITDYPTGWRKVATLIPDFAGLDSTVFQYDGRWWMFSTARVASGAYSLVAYYADELLGPWHPHARNPLSTDIATSRPGGKPFVADGALIRPAQDCSRSYGGALALMRVITLTPTEFDETRVRVVEPDPSGPYPNGFHTVYALDRKRTLVDGYRRILIPYVLKKALGLTA